jgi:hypothetical protein
MTSVPSLVVKSTLFSLMASAAFLATPADCRAFHGSTAHAWHRTWHGPWALDVPLRGYFIPRLPGRCDRDVYADGSGCTDGDAAGCVHVSGARGFFPPSEPGFLPAQFERLGQIPNDRGIDAALPASGPGR